MISNWDLWWLTGFCLYLVPLSPSSHKILWSIQTDTGQLSLLCSTPSRLPITLRYFPLAHNVPVIRTLMRFRPHHLHAPVAWLSQAVFSWPTNWQGCHSPNYNMAHTRSSFISLLKCPLQQKAFSTFPKALLNPLITMLNFSSTAFTNI